MCVLFFFPPLVLRDWISPFPFADEWRWKNGTFIFLYPTLEKEKNSLAISQ
jgi:hypothetical protein